VQFAPGTARRGLYPFVAGNMVAFCHPASKKPQELGTIYLAAPLSGGKPTPLITLPILWNIVSVRGDQHREWLLCENTDYPRRQRLLISDSSPPDTASAKLYAELPPDPTVAAVTPDWRLGALAEQYSGNPPYTWHIQALPGGGQIATIPKSRGLDEVAFSPDGKYLAAVRILGYEQQQVEVISLDDVASSWVITEVASDYSKPAWSPDGSRIAVCRYTKSPQVVFGRQQTERQMMVVQVGRRGNKPTPPKKDFVTIEKEFQAAQNRLFKLMAAGKGNTREAYEAHRAFRQLSVLYNEAVEARGEPVSD
jgi:hypothetical protein